MFPFSGNVVRYQEAVALVEKKSPDELLRGQMLYLLEKASDSTGVSAAARKLKDRYRNVDDRRVKKIYAKFDELRICPFTRPKG